MSRFRVVAIACCLVLPAVAAEARSAGGRTCASPEHVQAAQLRQFHNQLQVAALNCRGEDASLHSRWGHYVGRFGSTLSQNAQVLRGHFKTVAAFDRYNTEVTNRESVRVHETEGYCETRAQMFERVMGMDSSQLISFAAETVGHPDLVSACPTPVTKASAKGNVANGAKTTQAN